MDGPNQKGGSGMASKKIPLKGKIVFFALSVFTVYSVVSFIVINQAIDHNQRQLDQVREEILQLMLENGELSDLLENGMDQEDLIRLARERLGYVFPSERSYEDLTGQ